jgi:hypothetical protein
MREWVRRLQFLLVLVRAVILWPESRRTHEQILLPQIRESRYLEGQVPMFVSPGTPWPQALGSIFVVSYGPQGYGGGTRAHIHAGTSVAKIKVTLRLAVHRHSGHLAVRPVETLSSHIFHSTADRIIDEV